jgi:SAM-dependent methyltransferase
MSDQALREKWDARYRDARVEEAGAAEVLTEYHHLLPPAGAALDLACGLGGNALWLARAGLQVDAWDLSPVAIGKLGVYADAHRLAVRASVRDAIAMPPASGTYDVIVVAHFLERSLCPAIARALRPSGLLFYQTFGPTGPGPTNPAFRLAPQELPHLFAELELLVYREESEAKLVARHPG